MKKLIDFKSMLIGVITGSLLFGGIVGASTLITDNVYLNKYAVTVDGKSYTPTLPILNYANSTYVPLKEFGTITGASVTFSNNTIVVKKPTTTTQAPSTGTSTGTSSTTKPTTSALNGKKISLDVGDKDSFYVDLNAYGSKTANVSITTGTSYITLSKTSLTSSSLVNITAKKAGSATIKVAYNNGYTDYVTVVVNGSDEIEIDKDDYEYIEIDLDAYAADSATVSISSGKDYVSIDKTSFKKSGDLKVTGKKAGEAEIKIKYDSGDTVYYDIIVNSNNDEISVDIDYNNSKFIYYIDLDEYDATEAEIYIDDDDNCIKVNKEIFTSSGSLIITGLDEGTAEIEIEFLDDDYDIIDTFTINVTVLDDYDFDFDDYKFEDDLYIDKNSSYYINVDPDYYDAEWATISIVTGINYMTVSKTAVTTDTDIKITGKNYGEGIIQVTYSTGEVEYYYVEIE